ncbi:MAG: hypothetical protein COA42_08010 [Alteromonadaceae bacterium]|nr:MAG: hypothetical protein COA42_08010 [Alteromonadaceae bacterium]
MKGLILGASLLKKRLQLDQHVNSIVIALDGLLCAQQSQPATVCLINNFRHHKALIPVLGSWLGSSPNIALSDQQLELLLGARNIQCFIKEMCIGKAALLGAFNHAIPQMLQSDYQLKTAELTYQGAA